MLSTSHKESSSQYSSGFLSKLITGLAPEDISLLISTFLSLWDSTRTSASCKTAHDTFQFYAPSEFRYMNRHLTPDSVWPKTINGRVVRKMRLRLLDNFIGFTKRQESDYENYRIAALPLKWMESFSESCCNLTHLYLENLNRYTTSVFESVAQCLPKLLVLAVAFEMGTFELHITSPPQKIHEEIFTGLAQIAEHCTSLKTLRLFDAVLLCEPSDFDIEHNPTCWRSKSKS
jgi:hypothetical protein